MFGMLELPYYPATELRKIKQKNKRNWTNGTIDNGHFIFQMFNGRTQSTTQILLTKLTGECVLRFLFAWRTFRGGSESH